MKIFFVVAALAVFFVHVSYGEWVEHELGCFEWQDEKLVQSREEMMCDIPSHGYIQETFVREKLSKQQAEKKKIPCSSVNEYVEKELEILRKAEEKAQNATSKSPLHLPLEILDAFSACCQKFNLSTDSLLCVIPRDILYCLILIWNSVFSFISFIFYWMIAMIVCCCIFGYMIK